jgi:hypothetical protein
VESEREMLIGIQKEPRTHPHDGNGKWEMGNGKWEMGNGNGIQ